VRKLFVGPIEALQRYVSREMFHTACVLVGDYGWDVIDGYSLPHDADGLPAMLRRQFGGVHDVVLFRESYGCVVHHARALTAAGARIYVMTDDLHKRFARMSEALRLATGVLSTYAPRFSAFLPDVGDDHVTWVPHAAGPDFLMPVAEEPESAIFVSGMMSGFFYPLRVKMLELASQRPEIARTHRHPGYQSTFDYNGDERVGRGYAGAMRRCLAAFTDSSRFRYLVAKHFEIPATGALLVAERAARPQLAALGFVDGEHYVSADAHDLRDVVDYVLDDRNRPEIDAIRRAGHALVHERHTTRVRAQQIDSVCR
jgi:hypothetical protein